MKFDSSGTSTRRMKISFHMLILSNLEVKVLREAATFKLSAYLNTSVKNTDTHLSQRIKYLPLPLSAIIRAP